MTEEALSRIGSLLFRFLLMLKAESVTSIGTETDSVEISIAMNDKFELFDAIRSQGQGKRGFLVPVEHDGYYDGWAPVVIDDFEIESARQLRVRHIQKLFRSLLTTGISAALLPITRILEFRNMLYLLAMLLVSASAFRSTFSRTLIRRDTARPVVY